MHPHPLASQAVTRRAEAPLSCNATLRQVVLDPVTQICGVCDGFWYLATFRTLTTLQRGSTRRFTYLFGASDASFGARHAACYLQNFV